MLMKMMSKVILKEMDKKETKTEEDLETIEMINNGKSLVKEENLAPILEWLQ